MNGWPAGRDGRKRVGSNRLANSWIDGTFQPKRPPIVRVLHQMCAESQVFHAYFAVLGDRSQTSPVSLSRTASLLNWPSTLKRFGSLFWVDHDCAWTVTPAPNNARTAAQIVRGRTMW